MNEFQTKKALARYVGVLLCVLLLQGCVVGSVVGTAVDTTVAVVKLPFMIVGATVDVIVPGND